jgi:hypothetical protein
MGSVGSTTSVRAREMRRVLAQWQRSGLRPREFGEQRGIALSALRWWRRVFRAAGAAAPAVAFTEGPAPVSLPQPPCVHLPDQLASSQTAIVAPARCICAEPLSFP